MVTEPMVAMMYTTNIVQDEATGVTYMDTVTASVGSGPWEPPCGGHPPGTHCGGHNRPPLRSQAVSCQQATVEELAEEDLVEGHP